MNVQQQEKDSCFQIVKTFGFIATKFYRHAVNTKWQCHFQQDDDVGSGDGENLIVLERG